MASAQIRVTPAEAITQMTTIRGRLDEANAQAAPQDSAAGMDPTIVAAVQGQTQASQQLITTVSGTSDKSKTGAEALGEQDKKNQDRLGAVQTNIDNGVRGAGGPGAPRLPQNGVQMLNGPAPQGPMWPEPPAPNPSTFPESTLDGIHGTGSDNVNHITVVPKNPDGTSQLGPATNYMDPTVQVAPPSSPVDVWMPRSEVSGNLWSPSYPGELAPSNYEQIAPDVWWRRGSD